MKYVDWVEAVLRKTVEATSSALSGRLVGLSEIRQQLADTGSDDANDLDQAIWIAIEDLNALGILDVDSIHWVRLTQEARKVRHGASLRSVWPALAGRFLDPDQEAFLQKSVELAEEQHSSYAKVNWVEAADIVAGLGWPDDISIRYGMATALEGEGMVRQRATMGGFVSLRPTFAGVVRATEVAQAEWQDQLKTLVAGGETANVEFKRELALDNDRRKAEFVRDVLALANTNVSGPRYLIVGYEPRELRFHAPVDPNLTQDRMEDILNAWTEGAPGIRFSRVNAAEGSVGVLEILPQGDRIPYRPRKGQGKTLRPGEVFVRHGSHVEHPTEAEEQELLGRSGPTEPDDGPV